MEASSRHQDAGTEPGLDEIEEKALLGGTEWSNRSVAGSDQGGGGERILLVEHEVSGSDGELGDGDRVAGVTEIDQAGEQRFVVGISLYQQIVVVGIVVNDAAFEARQARDDLASEALDMAFDQVSPGGLGDLFGEVREIVGALDIPRVVAMCARVVKAAKCQIEVRECPADLLEERGRPLMDVDQGCSVQE